MLRQEGRASPGDLRKVSVLAATMERLLTEGDGLLIDTARRPPTTGELFARYCHVKYPERKELVNAFPSGTRHLLVHVKCFGSE